jgi:hypothetical protein
VGFCAIGIAATRIAGDVADGVVGVGVVIRACVRGAVGGAAAVAGEGRGQPVEIVVLEALLLAPILPIHQARAKSDRNVALEHEASYTIHSAMRFTLYQLRIRYRILFKR